MKIVNFSGGLGNQMFQYAFLVAVRETFNKEVLMDTSLFKGRDFHNGFELTKLFNITAKEAEKKDIKKLTPYFTNYYFSRIYWKYFPRKKTECQEINHCEYNDKILTEDKDLYFYGIWQNPKYFNHFKDVIVEEFTFKTAISAKNEEALAYIQKSPTTSIHIRRGDYLKHANYMGLCGVEYYKNAINHVKEKHPDNKFIIFSNDMEWCKENIVPIIGESEYICADWNKGSESYNDMRLMSLCDRNIIANSSFSWWAAYLNQHKSKEIIAPKIWTNSPVKFNRQLDSWTLF
jgi:uncharacterized short protein YbdD (DUF466 family)